MIFVERFIEEVVPVRISYWLCGGNECGLIEVAAMVVEEDEDSIVYKKLDNLSLEPSEKVKKENIEQIKPISKLLEELYYYNETVSMFAFEYCQGKSKEELKNITIEILLNHLDKYTFEDIDTYIFNCNMGWYIDDKIAYAFIVDTEYKETTTVGDLFKEWAAYLLQEEINNIIKILYN